MKILLSGSSGLIGSALYAHFLQKGDCVVCLPRSYEEPIDFSGVDVVLHLAGENIASGRWNRAKKRAIKESRIKGTSQLAQQIAKQTNPPRIFICASATGFYGDRGAELLHESSAQGDGFLAEVCAAWEQAARFAKTKKVRCVQLRTGMVLSKQGGALPKMLPLFRWGGGAVLGNGNQLMSWILLDDVISAIDHLIDDQTICGPVNLTTPHPVTNREFTAILGRMIQRPAFMKIPAFVLRLLVGKMADEVLLSSARVYPEKLIKAGYSFKHKQLEAALRSILNEE